MASDKGEPQAKRVKIAGPPTVNSNECITFHLLKKTNGTVTLDKNGLFPPDMSHQYVIVLNRFICCQIPSSFD